MDRPYIICHMLTSLDGKVTGDFLGKSEYGKFIEDYYRIHREYGTDGFLCGRVTMEGSFPQPPVPSNDYDGPPIERKDYIAEKAAFYAVAIDPKGKLWWSNRAISHTDEGYNGAHIIEVLTESVPDTFLAHLRNKGVSYLFAGKTELNLPLAVQKLKGLFGIQTLLLEGGGIANGSFLQEELIDEISLVVVPAAECNENAIPLFKTGEYGAKTTLAKSFQLKELKRLNDNGLWLIYSKNKKERMDMYNFVFQNTTKIYFGENQLCHLGEELKQYGTRVLLTYGRGSIKRIGLYDKVMEELKRAGLTIFELSGIEPNPRHTTVNKGADICKKENIDVLLAVGGGSTIDCTKVIAAAAFYQGDSWDLVTHKAPVTKALPVLTVLTLSATGSEMDSGAVISNMDTNEKYGLLHPLLQPKVSFLDPVNTYSVSAFQTACGAADILSHVFDCFYFTATKKMDMVDRVMEDVIKTVVKYAPIAVKEPENYEARANLMWASSWALNGFLQTGGFQAPSCHAMEHELSAFYDITHGLGLAILTPRWMKYILDESIAPQFKKFGVNIFGVDESLSDMEGAERAIACLSDFFFKTLGLQSTLTEIGIDDKNFKVMAKKACGGDVLQGFKPLTPEDVENIFRMCL